MTRELYQHSDNDYAAKQDVLHGAACDVELVHWLSCQSRCFGDKGDVEDITEG